MGFSELVRFGCRFGGVEGSRTTRKQARILKTTELFFIETPRLQKWGTAVGGGCGGEDDSDGAVRGGTGTDK